jgi:hypothetical protein
MKKYILFVLLAAVLVLGACANGGEVTEDKKSDDVQTKEEVKTDSDSAEKTETEKAPVQQGENAEKEEPAVSNGFDVKYNAEDKSVQLVKADGTTEVLAAGSATEPVKSPDSKKAAYVSPVEFEELGDVYIVNLEDGTQSILVASENQETPKKVIWEDDKNVLVIIGQAYGTVGVGGNIYRVNLETKEKTALTNYEGDIQITDFKIENGILKYSGIKYTDDNFNESVEYANEKSL